VRDDRAGTVPPAVTPKTVGITGASGYVGGLIADEFARRGDRVVELGRRRRSKTAELRYFALGQPMEPGIFEGLDVLVHAAYDLTLRSRPEVWAINVAGTRAITDRAQSDGVGRIILISSMSAYDGTEQIYGQAKLACERLVCRTGGVGVRLGLVCGSGGGGMIESLTKLARLPVIPVPGPGAHQYLVHESQVGPAISAVADSTGLAGEVIGLAHPVAVPFRDILASLATPPGRARFFDVPWQPIFTFMKLAERLGIDLPLRADSMLGLVRPAPVVQNVAAWRSLGVSLPRVGTTRPAPLDSPPYTRS
jgi:nucleoside-diphosphate-sugar epimerase